MTWHHLLYIMSQKGATILMAVTSSNLNQFSKFFYHWREGNFQQNPCIIFHHTLSVLLHYLWEFKTSKLLQIWTKMQKKNATSLVAPFIWDKVYKREYSPLLQIKHVLTSEISWLVKRQRNVN